MGARAPRSVEQCIGCSAAVAVYSDRQLVDFAGGREAVCASCRRTARADERRELKTRIAARKAAPAPKPAKPICKCATPIVDDFEHDAGDSRDYCRTCWYPIETA